MVCCNLDEIKVRTKMQVDFVIFIFFCYIFGVDDMRVISMVVVKGTLFTYLTYAEYFTSRVNVILLIFNDSITDVIWAGYTHMVSSALSASNSYFYCLK